MHEEAGTNNHMPGVDATAEAADQAEEPVQEADVDDDMDEDEEVCAVFLCPCNVAGNVKLVTASHARSGPVGCWAVNQSDL